MDGSDDELLDPFSGLPSADGPSLLAVDDGNYDQDGDEEGEDEDEDEDGSGDAAAAAVAAAASSATADENAGATDESHLPPWMRSAHATIIRPSTPAIASLGLDARLLTNLKRMGVRKAFPVQATVIPVVLAAHAARCAGDVCACAPTGSGKTLAYALPVVQSLLPRVVTRLRALVLLPTRGLAAQVKEVFASLCEGTGLKVGLAAGHEGVSWERERASILNAPPRAASFFPSDDPRSAAPAAAAAAASGGSSVDILVATPGRLVEHLQATGGGFTLMHLRWLVVDEADRLLTFGYQDWLAKVLDAAHYHPSDASPFDDASLPSGIGTTLTRRPTLGSAHASSRAPQIAYGADPPLLKLLFSATLTRSAAKLAPLKLLRPRYFCVSGARYATPSTLKEWMLMCHDAGEKPKLLVLLLRRLLGMSRDEDEKDVEVVDEEEGEEDAVAAADEEMEEEAADDNENGEEDADDEDASGGAAKRRKLSAPKRSKGGSGPGGGGGPPPKVIVFASSLESTHRLTRLLQLLMGLDVGEFSSAVRPKQRTRILERLKSGACKVLVASDAMARGMDVEGVTSVINYDPPANIKGYVHRVGRTARAGKAGTSYTLLENKEVHHFKSSMAKAGKAWRPMALTNQSRRLGELQDEYQYSLDRLGAVLSAERSGELNAAGTREDMEKAVPPT